MMIKKMQKFSDAQDYERANEVKQRIKSIDLLHQEQSFNNALASVDFFACTSKLNRTGICILSVRDGKIRGTKTYCLSGNLINEIDDLFQSLIFAYYQNVFTLPDKIISTLRLNNKTLIKDAIKLKFKKNISISSNLNSKNRKIAKLAILNANQVIDNKTNRTERYNHAFKNLALYLGIKNGTNFLIEGYDVSHQSGKYGVASLVRFTNKGPDKSGYRIYNIPDEFSGNDIGSIKNILERRIKKISSNPVPDIILVDGGKLQLNAAIKIFNEKSKIQPIVLSIVKGSKRVRSTETILSKNGIVEMPKNSPGFILLQQIRDESHRFAIKNSRMQKLKSVKFSELQMFDGVGPVLRERLLKKFKTLKSLKKSTAMELSEVKGISTNLAKKILVYLKQL